jgi:hypothetical protein
MSAIRYRLSGNETIVDHRATNSNSLESLITAFLPAQGRIRSPCVAPPRAPMRYTTKKIVGTFVGINFFVSKLIINNQYVMILIRFLSWHHSFDLDRKAIFPNKIAPALRSFRDARHFLKITRPTD